MLSLFHKIKISRDRHLVQRFVIPKFFFVENVDLT